MGFDGCGLVVSVLTFYSVDPSSNPAVDLNNFPYEKTKMNENETSVGLSLNKSLIWIASALGSVAEGLKHPAM